MAGSHTTDTCPFCEAAWGECGHVRLLIAFVKEAETREAVNAEIARLGYMPREASEQGDPGEPRS
ncbi:hypothetical protein [Hoeflea sp.]|uniref:hypothetical protein n=1 Tax=Hoeflea sp. TaxID=1940281 RepID=UPI003BB1B258